MPGEDLPSGRSVAVAAAGAQAAPTGIGQSVRYKHIDAKLLGDYSIAPDKLQTLLSDQF